MQKVLKQVIYQNSCEAIFLLGGFKKDRSTTQVETKTYLVLLVAQTLALRKKFCLFLFLFCFLVLFIFYCYKVEFELKFRSSSKRWDKLVEGNSIENISPMQIISFTEMGSKIRFKFLQ